MASPSGFNALLDRHVERSGSAVCVGLDPVGARLPKGFTSAPADLERFLVDIVDATAPHAAAFKPNVAFYEALGRAGTRVLETVVDHIHQHTDALVVLDVKRGDVGHTAKAYAVAAYDELDADAVTISPYLGRDAVAPFAERPERGVFVLARTSNPSAGQLQDLEVAGPDGAEPLYVNVARQVRQWDEHGNLGLVAGATYPEEVARLRRVVGDQVPFLVPGVGAQGGDVPAAVRAAVDGNGRGFLINSGRAIVHASEGDDYAAAAGQAAGHLQAAINEAVAARADVSSPAPKP